MSVMHKEPLTFLHNSGKTETPVTTHPCEEFTVLTFCLQAMTPSIWYNKSLSSVGWEGKKIRHKWSHSCYEMISRCVDTYLLNFFDVFVLFCFLFYSHLWWLRATIWVMELNQNPTEATSAPHR